MTAEAAVRVWRDDDPTRRTALVTAVVALGLAGWYALAIATGTAEVMLLAPLAAVLVVVLVAARPAAGLYLVFAGALLLEQFDIAGISPLTAHTRFYQNLSTFTPIPLRLSAADLLVLLTFASIAVRHFVRKDRARTGPLALAAGLYAAAFAVGLAIGIARGGFDGNAALAEIRGPLYLVALYFLTADVIRDRRQAVNLVAIFGGVVAIKALQGLANASLVASAASVEAVTGHEDVVFFNAAIGVALVALVLPRTRLRPWLVASVPLIMLAELVTERRVGFVGLAAVVAAIVVLLSRTHPRAAIAIVAATVSGLALYLPLFWDSSGAIAEPIRALRTILGDPGMTVRDQLSDHWRVIEDSNIAFTMRQLPLTGVGVGQEYLFQREPPVPSTTFVFWRFMTHNALLWLWLKAGPLGALALAFFVARTLLVSSRLFATLRDAGPRLVAVLPLGLVIAQVVFSSVELGLTYSRTMIVLGVATGSLASLSALRSEAA